MCGFKIALGGTEPCHPWSEHPTIIFKLLTKLVSLGQITKITSLANTINSCLALTAGRVCLSGKKKSLLQRNLC